MRGMKISSCLIDYVVDADLHTLLHGVEYSTDLREIVTVGYMMRRHELENEKAACEKSQTA